MKNLIYLLAVALVMLFSCTKAPMDEEVSPGVKNLKKVPVPMKIDICMTPDTNRLHVEGTPLVNELGDTIIPSLDLSVGSLLSGHGTHIGQLIKEESNMTGYDAYLMTELLPQGKVVIAATYDGILTAANHDKLSYISYIQIDVTKPPTKIITGDVELTGGTGRFEGATGNCTINGIVPCWSVDGYILFAK